MSFYSVYEYSRAISPVVRGLAKLIKGGKWTHWCGDGGAWRGLSPAMTAEWGQSLDFSRVDRDVRWPKGMGCECHPLTAAEKEHLYAIYERVYLIPEREAWTARLEQERHETEQRSAKWLERLAAAGKEA